MSHAKTKIATSADIAALLPNVVGESLFGVPHTQPRTARDAITFDLRQLWPFDKPIETDGY